MNKIINETRTLFYFATPLIFNLLAYMGMQLVDVLMLGRLGPVALASAAAANVMFIIALAFSIGILTAVGTLSAEAFGQKNQDKVSIYTQQGLWVAIILAIPSMLWVCLAPAFLQLIHQPAVVVLGAKAFLRGLLFGILPALIFITWREVLTAVGKPRIVMVISIAAIPLNAILNYLFIYGKLGLPRLGIFGVGLATSIVEWCTLFATVIYIVKRPNINQYQPLTLKPLVLPAVLRIFRLGLPVGTSFAVEELLFVITTLLMGYISITAMAAHQIALQCLYTISMIPLGIAQAAAIRVSHAIGSNDHIQSQRIAYIAVVSGMVLALITAILIWIFPTEVVQLFISPHNVVNQTVIDLAARLLIITAIFHIIDASQIITNGALRGYQDTLIPMVLGLLSYWAIGLGSGYFFGFVLTKGAPGLWWGLALGITAAALLLQWRLATHRRLKAIT